MGFPTQGFISGKMQASMFTDITPQAKKAAYWLLKNVNRALREFNMLSPTDRVAVGLSGGKDSLTLLSLLAMRNITVQFPVPLLAIHILGDSNGVSDQFHTPLKAWLDANAFDYRIVPLEINPGESLPLNCQRCAHHRRRALFQVARENGCNVVALGHHADDLAETTLMNLLSYGRVETMAPRRDYFDGIFRVIRPLCLTPEKDIRRFARLMNFPVPPPLCPRSDETHRALARQIIELAEKENTAVPANLLRAGLAANAILPGRVKQDDGPED